MPVPWSHPVRNERSPTARAILLRILLSLASLSLVGPAADAQIELPHLSLSVRSWKPDADCTDAPRVCEGRTSAPGGNTYIFDVYLPVEYEPMAEIRFALDWPEAWDFVEWGSCEDTLVSGDPSVPGSGLWFRLSECRRSDWDAQPFFWIVLDCGVPGRIEIVNHPETGDYAVLSCDEGRWIPDWAYHGYRYVEIGDYCRRRPILDDPCDYCLEEPGPVRFEPESLVVSVPQAGTHVDTVMVRGSGHCYPPIPECGGSSGDPTFPCFTGVATGANWLAMRLIEETEYRHWYEVWFVAPTQNLGVYATLVNAKGCCGGCMNVAMEVTPAAGVRKTTWGRVKTMLGPPADSDSAQTKIQPDLDPPEEQP